MAVQDQRGKPDFAKMNFSSTLLAAQETALATFTRTSAEVARRRAKLSPGQIRVDTGALLLGALSPGSDPQIRLSDKTPRYRPKTGTAAQTS